jgi:hypothetical protein
MLQNEPRPPKLTLRPGDGGTALAAALLQMAGEAGVAPGRETGTWIRQASRVREPLAHGGTGAYESRSSAAPLHEKELP